MNGDGRRQVVEHARAHAVALATLDPAAALDDLAPLRDLVGDARVVAIGENTHHVREFYLVRHRFTRFLVEQCGFTHFAMEAPFTEGVPIAEWVAGGPGDIRALATQGMAFGMGECDEMQAHLRWMRDHNEASARSGASRVEYAGIDPPHTLGSLVPALEALRRYVGDLDRDTAAIIERLISVAATYEAVNLSLVVPSYDTLDDAAKDELTATLGALRIRFQALRPLLCRATGVPAYDVAYRHLESAVYLDVYLREMSAYWAGTARFGDGSAREVFMADSIEWLLERGGPDAKVVLAAHNAHIQRVPMPDEMTGAMFVQGYHLADRFGSDYVSVAVTSGGGTTVRMDRDETHPFGVQLEEVAVPAAVDGSIEAVFEAAECGSSILDLRPLRGQDVGVDKIRMAEHVIDLPVVDAYDAVVLVGETSASSFLGKVEAGRAST